MKKTYIAPEIESVKLSTISVIAGSQRFNIDVSGQSGNVVSEGSVWSKEYGGGLWDDTAEDE